MIVGGPDIFQVWHSLLMELVSGPERTIAPRGHATQEILGVQLEVQDLRRCLLVHPARNLNYRFAVAELFWIAFGLDDVSLLTRYNSQMSRFSDDGVKLAGAYGPRLAPQWEYVRNTLRKDPDTRQAVATIWTPSPLPSKDVPCTISLQWLLRENRLNIIATMRSSDVWLGVPYDAHVFATLTNMLAGELGVETGKLVMQLGSSHLYVENLEAARAVLDKPGQGRSIEYPRLLGWPKAADEFALQRAMTGLWERLSHPYWERYRDALLAKTWSEARIALEGEAASEQRS